MLSFYTLPIFKVSAQKLPQKFLKKGKGRPFFFT